MKTSINSCQEDEEFRKFVGEALDSAEKEVVVITGEFGAYSSFSELREKVHSAIARGVKFKVYANEASPSDIRDIKERGGEFYTGEIRAGDHYLVIDRNNFIISDKEGVELPTKIGERKGCQYTDDAKRAKKIIEYFNDLISASFAHRMKKKSMLTRIADYIFRIFVFGYGKAKEPKINE